MPEPQPTAEPSATKRLTADPAIDLAALAERVYRLMLEDLRLEQARAGTLNRRVEVRR